MEEKRLKYLLNKYALNTLSAEEQEELFIWYKSFENKPADLHLQNLDVYSSRVKERIFTRIDHHISAKQRMKTRKWLSVAASITLLIGLSLGYGLKNNWFGVTYIKVHSADTHKILVLDDGSEIILNKNSTLKYPSRFTTQRTIYLSGEAFFKVAKDSTKPFNVITGEVSTTVLGTQFNVHQTDTSVDVTVTEGKVRVAHGTDHYNIIKDEQVRYLKTSDLLSYGRVDHLISTVWMKEKIVLNNISMQELSAVIQNIYGMPMQFNEAGIKQLKMSITFRRNESLQQLLEKISYINNVKLKTQKEVIEVSY